MPDLAPQETSFEYFVDPDSSEWEHWQSRVPGMPPAMSSFPFVPTIESTRLSGIASLLLQHGVAVLVTGQPGVGKTSTLADMLYNPMIEDAPMFKRIALSVTAQPAFLQKNLEAELKKVQGGVFGPPAGRQMVIFVDDVNLPAPDEFGAVGSVELLRQLIEDNGLYAVDGTDAGSWLSLERVRYLASIKHIPGNAISLPDRLRRHFVMLNLNLPNRTSLDNILTQILKKQLDPRGMSYTASAIAAMCVVFG